MLRTALLCASLLALSGCSGSDSSITEQRFVLVPDPTGINKDIPAGALALDTKTGQLCFTVSGGFMASAPTIDACAKLSGDGSKKKP
jgi:hypothetical protein